eukprot:3875526-Rhodomonas_salina.1
MPRQHRALPQRTHVPHDPQCPLKSVSDVGVSSWDGMGWAGLTPPGRPRLVPRKLATCRPRAWAAAK